LDSAATSPRPCAITECAAQQPIAPLKRPSPAARRRASASPLRGEPNQDPGFFASLKNDTRKKSHQENRKRVTLVQTCKHLRINPFAYLRDVIERVSTILRGWSWS
jgi:hypothetical protein